MLDVSHRSHGRIRRSLVAALLVGAFVCIGAAVRSHDAPTSVAAFAGASYSTFVAAYWVVPKLAQALRS